MKRASHRTNTTKLTNRIVQAQRIISMPPIISDPRVRLNDKRRHAQTLESRRELQPTLPTAADQHHRVLVCKRSLQPPLFRPEIIRFVVAEGSDLLREPLGVLEICEHAMAFPLSALREHQSKDAGAQPDVGFESECALNPRHVREGRLEFDRILVELETQQAAGWHPIGKESGDLGRPVKGAEVPGKGEYVPPERTVGKDGEDTVEVFRLDVPSKSGKPVLCDLFAIGAGWDGRDESRESRRNLRVHAINVREKPPDRATRVPVFLCVLFRSFPLIDGSVHCSIRNSGGRQATPSYAFVDECSGGGEFTVRFAIHPVKPERVLQRFCSGEGGIMIESQLLHAWLQCSPESLEFEFCGASRPAIDDPVAHVTWRDVVIDRSCSFSLAQHQTIAVIRAKVHQTRHGIKVHPLKLPIAFTPWSRSLAPSPSPKMPVGLARSQEPSRWL